MHRTMITSKFSPITDEVGFIDTSIDKCVDAFVTWFGPIQLARGATLRTTCIAGAVPHRLSTLLPLTSHERRRMLFLPTNSNWTAYLDNSWRGTDAYSVVSHLCLLLGCHGVRARSSACNTRSPRKPTHTMIKSIIFELYSPTAADCDFLNTRRSVSMVIDGTSKTFDTGGAPLDFEQVDRYASKRIEHRFDADMLNAYLQQMGIHAFDEQYFVTRTPAMLIEVCGAQSDKLREYTLDQAKLS